MEKYKELLKNAAEREASQGLPYAGALTPKNAFQLLSEIPNARLVDVRTKAEWNWVGRVPNALEIEWNQWPGGTPNPDFATTLISAVPDKETPLFFLCRSGVRSHAAATLASELGYRNAFNILEGFEGDKDDAGRRNSIGGWRVNGLPWIQS